MSMQLYTPPVRLWDAISVRPTQWEKDNPHTPDHLQQRLSNRTDIVLPNSSWYMRAKDLFDLIAASILLVVLGPVMLLAALATKLTSPGPAFYKQTRVGRDGRLFRIWKIRTMKHNAESTTGAVWSQENDPRVTRVGRFLRSSHIDEFPQLFQILSGEMSLIGPRPERPEFIQHLQWQVPRYSERLMVKPGVTGLAQLLLPPDSDTEGVRRKIQCDLYYVRYLSPWMDARILIQTGFMFIRSIGGALLSPFRLPSTDLVQRHMAELNELERNL